VLQGKWRINVSTYLPAALGHMESHYQLSCMYGEGKGKKREMYLEEAAMEVIPTQGSMLEQTSGTVGDLKSIETISDRIVHWTRLRGFVNGIVSKDDYAAALRGHQAAVDATKSCGCNEKSARGRS